MSIGEFTEQNPWWIEKEAIENDKLIVDWKSSKIPWMPRLEKTIEWDSDVIYVLRGPRQVGKTTMLKLKIREMLHIGTEPRTIFYWPCDLVEGPEELVRIVASYQDASRRDQLKRLYIMLDEISSIKDWQRGIKSLYDSGRLRNCTVVLTGSHSIDLRKASETLARRRGEVQKLRDQLPDKILLPMKFSEYVETRSERVRKFIHDLDLFRREQRHKLWANIMDGRIPEQLEELQLLSKELQTLFNEFLLTGGIPKAVDVYLSTGSISRDVYDGYVELLVSDIRRWQGNEGYLRQIMRRIVETIGTPITLNSLRQETDISSHHTTGAYLDFLRDSFVATVILKLDKNRDMPVFRNSRKVHFEDPFLFHSLRAWSLGREPFRETLNFLGEPEKTSKLVECIVANHIVRLLFSYQLSTQFDYSSLLFHWQSKKQRQLDFVAKMENDYLPIEVKYQNRVNSEDAGPIIDFQRGGKSTSGVLLTKNSLAKKRSYIEIPVSLALTII